VEHRRQNQISARSKPSQGDIRDLSAFAEQRPLSPSEWGEVQAIVHTLDQARYSPKQAVLVDRALQEFPTLVTSIGVMGPALIERLIYDLGDTHKDTTEELWREIGKQQAE
jgi:hypothetical protein